MCTSAHITSVVFALILTTALEDNPGLQKLKDSIPHLAYLNLGTLLAAIQQLAWNLGPGPG
jgi:hypothetical protein